MAESLIDSLEGVPLDVRPHHGLAFHRKEWPTPATRIQIWRDDSVEAQRIARGGRERQGSAPVGKQGLQLGVLLRAVAEHQAARFASGS